ncbi:MAG: glycosyltransferase [Betaproteobacteria bacterium]|nr:glycosyltransferase [Betaproteobacteria bacterium]
MSASVQRKLQQAHQHLQNGNAAAAAASCEDVLQRAPRNPDALWLLGAARLMAGRADEAASLLERVVLAAPDHGAALEQLGVAHLIRADYAAAEKALRAAKALRGAPASVHVRLGLALFHQGKHADAIDALRRALELDPLLVEAHAALGRAYGAQGNWSEAQRAFEAILARAPDDADTLYNLGIVSFEQGDAAAACSWFERCLSRAPGHIEARERLAAAYLILGRIAQASAELRRIVDAQPANFQAICSLAEASFQSGALDDAVAFGRRALALDPAQSRPYSLIAQAHHVRGELDLAVDALEEGFARTHADPLLGTLVHLTHRQCDWSRWSSAWAVMQARLGESAHLGSPLWLLSENTTPEQQLSYTQRWVAQNYPAPRPETPLDMPRRERTRERIRIGYYSGDFHQHPVPCLAVETFELHDRSRFEVFAYSYGPDDGSALRRRLENAFEHFVDVAWDPDDVVEKRMREDDLDILIDLKGYTAGDRLAVMARRPCALQVEWLGYPGPMGAPFIDYVIADEIVIPPGAERHYSERVVRLPHCYQANDRKRPSPAPRPRAQYGLPEDGFVFCCFNQTAKITPDVFERWMALLRAVPMSVLWLLEDNRWANANLKSAAQASGIDADRVIIAPRLPVVEHLARYRAADLALDTFPYTSHTTGSDALWSGCPLVALRGETFAARVSASLLTHCGVPELITDSLDRYQALAYALATDPARLQALRVRLSAARESAPLFDSAAFTRDLESLYVRLLRAR